MAKYLTSIKPQHFALNVLAFVLVLVISCFGGSWQSVVSLYAVLGALCFLWTRPTVVVSSGQEQLNKLEEKIKEAHSRISLVASKISMKGV